MQQHSTLHSHLNRHSRSAVARLIRATLALATLLAPAAAVLENPRVVFAAEIPNASSTPIPDNTPFVGTTQAFSISFENTGDQTGYGPYALVELPTGISYASASYLGSTVTPIAPTPAICAAGVFTNPLTNLGSACAPGNQMLVLQYPFGSFTVGQPTAVIQLNTTIGTSATLVGASLVVTTTGGYIYGNTPTGNTPTLGTPTTTTIVPTLYRLRKTYIGPESETATGPNFPRSFRLTAEIAPGQTISNFRITDTLPNNIVVLNTPAFTYSPATASLSVPPTYTLPAEGNSFTALWPSVSGGAGPGAGSVTLDFPFYVSRTNASGVNVLNATTGAFSQSVNTGNSSGVWAQGGVTVTSNTATDTLTDKSIAIQKSVASSSGSNLPGTTLTYTLGWQVSDFFTVGDVVITDTFDNAQDYVDGSPVFSVTDRNTSISNATFPVTHTTVTTNADGSITLVYNVSAAMVALGQADGILQGGLITTTNFGATTGALQFRTTVRDLYRAPGPPTGPVQPNDSANNNVTIGASIRDNSLITSTTGYQTDTSAASVLIQPGQLFKTIYAINGSTTFPSPVAIKPDDAVTYRLRYDIPIGDFSVLRIYDFLPLPIFNASTMVYSNSIEFTAAAPAIGEWSYGPASASSAARLPAGAGVTVTVGSAANSIAWDFGGRSDSSNTSTTVDVLFTVRATNKPMADGLFLTNQARTQQINSVGTQTIADNIVQIQIREPSLAIRKGVIGVYNGPGNAAPDDPALNVQYDLTQTLPLSVTYSPANVCSARFNTIITSTMLSDTPRPFNADASFADAGDRATFAIVLENIGSAPAFGTTLSDTLPAGYTYVPGSLCMQTGDGTLIDTTTLTPTTLLGGSVTLSGTIAEGRARGSSALTNTTGSNIVIVTYDAIIDSTTGPNATLLNTTGLVSYTNSANGENMLAFTPSADRTDTASVSTSSPDMAKSLDSTEISATNNSLAGQATVGELITYTIHITVPEGGLPNLVITDAMASNSGLAFVDCVGVSASSGLTSTIGAFSDACADGTSVGSNPLISNTGRSAVWNLGTVLNSDTDNSITEKIEIQYLAVVRDIAGIVNGGTVVNRISASYGDTISTTTNVSQFSSPSVGVVEPSLSQSKSNTPGSGDAGDTITYTLVVTNAAGRAPAYNVVVTDVFPAKLVFTPNSVQATPEFDVVSSTAMLTATFAAIAPGSTARITFTGVLSEAVNPTELIVNNASARGTSLPGLEVTPRSTYDITGTVERSANSSNSTYVTSAASNASVQAMTLAKALVDTEINTTGNTSTQATVGELITYTLLITVPEGTSANVRITDTMATGSGLAFVDCVAVTAPASVSSSIDALSNACLDGTAVTDNPVVSGNGLTVTWNLGTLVNTDTDNTVTETLRITYTAVVRNLPSNVNSATLTNRANGTYGASNTLAQVSAASITIVEQNLSQSKASSPATGDAGDTITYTIVVTNTSGRAPAYDVVITDVFPSKFVYNTGSFVSTPDSTVISTSAGLTATFAVITPGTTARITVTGVLSESLNPTEIIVNRTGAAGTSLPGLATTARSTYDTISTTERISNSSNSTYLTSAQSSVTAPAITLGKALVSTEISTTGNTSIQAAVGELITYTLLITVPEGTSANVRITDTMATSSRLTFVDCIAVTAPASISSSIGALSNACDDGTAGSNNPVISSSGRTVAWNLGTLVNTDTDNTVTETLRITYTAVVRNIVANVDAIPANNRVSGTYGTSNTLAQVSAANITIVEQNLSQSKASSPTGGDAGDTITYTIVVTNASGRAPAYDVVITDVFPSKFVYNTGSFASTPDSSVISTSAGLTATFAVITPGTTARITVTGILSVAVIPSEVITNFTGAAGTSLPGLAGVGRSTYDSANTTERTLNSSNSTYQTSANSPETITSPAIAKTLVGSEINNAVNGAAQAAIGERLTYRLVLNAPEGTMPNARITDSLPTGLAYVTCNSLDASAGITTSVVGGFAGVCNGITAPAVSNPGQSVVFDLGTLTNSADSNGVTEQITITYDAIVLNIAGNQTGTLLNNSAQYGWNGRTLGTVNAGNVRVIEPLMGVLKTVSPAQPTSADAGDTITYTVVITGPSGADGNDVQLYDALPKTASGSLILSPTIVSAVAAPNSPTISSGDFALSGDNDNGWALTTATSLDLPVNIGRRITVTLAGTLPSYVAPGSTFTNTAVLSYTTIDGVGSGVQRSTFNTNSTERDGSGGINDYTTNNSATLNVTQVVPQKLIVATSEQATATGADGNPRIAIGEVVQYRVVITMSEGTAATFSIKDNLPTGLSFVSGSARAGFVASYGAGAGITSTAITPADTGCAALNITAGDIASVPSSSITCPVPAGRISLDGSNNPTFDFGTVANFDTDADNEYLVVEFQAVAQNVAGNTAGTQRANTATTTVNGQSLSATAPVTVTVAEPSLTTRKSVTAPSPLDAGDRVTFTIVYTNGTGANVSTAFDAVITDVLDSNLTLESVSLDAPAPAVAYTAASNSIVTDTGWLTVTVAQLDPGGVVTVTALARVNGDVAAGRRITNTGYLAYTSVPTDTGTINGSFLGTPGAAGSGTGERTGTGGVNSYAASSTVTLTATTPTIVKSTASPTQYTIGAPIYYSLTVTLPEGVATNVSVLDDLPTGLTYVSSQLVTSAAASGGLLSADFDGTIAGPVVTQPNGDALFSFGNITTTADNTANNTFVIQVLARIANSPTNQQSGGTAIFQNTVRLTYTHAISGVTGLSNGPITVSLREPRVVAHKRVTPDSGVQAGDTLTYAVTLTNTGFSTAYDTTLTDTLPAGLDGAEVVAVTLDNSASSSSLSGSAPNLSFGEWDIPVNSVLRLTYTVRVLDAFVIDGAYTNTVDADWSSLDGVDANERLYDDNNSYNYDGSQDTATATFASNGVTLAKTDGGVTTAPIGSVIRYTLTVSSPLGTLRNLRITDTLPAGLSYAGNTSMSGNISPQPSPITSSQNVIWSFGDGVITPTGSVTLAFDARVLDTAGNDNGNGKTNNVTLTHVAVTGTLRTRNASDGFSIAEPRIAAAKRVTPASGAQAGDTLTYVVTLTNTGTSTAYETTFTDTLPAGLDGASVVAAALDGTAVSTTLGGSAPNLSFGEWDMAVNSVLQVTYTVRITDGFVIDGAYTNTVDADWSSLDGINANERVYNDTTVYTVDGTQDTATAVFTSNGVTFSKSDGGVTTAQIGSVIRYTLTVNSPLGTLRDLRITDTLPTGMSYAGNASMSGNISPQPSPVTSSQDVIWTFNDAVITPTGSVTLAFDARVLDTAGNDSGGLKTNNATLTHVAVTGTLRTRSDSDSFTIAEPRIAAAKRVTPGSGVQAGDTLTYVVTLTNTGTNPAYETTFTDTLPAGLDGASVIAATLDGSTVAASLSGSAPSLSFGEWDMAVNSVLQVTYTVRITDGFVIDGAYTNTVDADWTSADGIDANERVYNDTTAYSVDGTQDTATAVFTSNGVTLAKTDGGVSTASIGSVVRYTLTVSSPLGTLRDLRITDTLPTGMSYAGNASISSNLSPQPSASTSGQDVIWSFGNAIITPTGSVSIAFDAVIDDVAGNSNGVGKTNNATLTHVAVTGTLRTRTDSDSLSLVEPALVISKRVQTPDALIGNGDLLTYTLLLTNTGNATAYNVRITDSLPVSITYFNTEQLSVTNSAVTTDSNATFDRNLAWDVSSLNAGGSITVVYRAMVLGGVPYNSVLTNTAAALFASTPGITPTRNYTTPVVNASVRSASPQVQMVKTSPLSSVRPDGLLTYTILLTNTGIVDAVGVVITDGVPLSTTFVSADSGGAESSGVVTWTIPSFSAGGSASVRMVVRVAPTLLNGTSIVNTAYITSTDGGVITPTSTLTVPVVSAHALDIEKSVAPDTAAPGDIVTYTVVYTVSGDEPAFGVMITDVLPGGVTFVSSDPAPSSQNGQTTIWSAGAFSPTASTPVTGSIVFSAQLASTPTLSGTAYVNAIVIRDSTDITDTDTARVTVDSSHVLAISKWTEQVIATAGTQVTYTLAYTVTGNEPSLNTTVSDVLPDGVSFVSATPTASTSSSTAATWSLGPLVPNTSGVITIVGLLASNVAPDSVLTNTAVITDAQGLSATATATNTVIVLSNPAIFKLGAPDPVVSGGIVTYTLVFTNNGPSDAQNVIVTDTLPAHVSWNGAYTASLATSRISALPLAWSLGTLSVGESGLIVFTGTVSSAADYSITNTVIITTSTPDSNGDNNSSSVVLGVNYTDIYVIKSVEPSAPVRPGDTVTWTLRYGNEGQATARDVSISDTLPAGITWGGEYTSTGSLVFSATTPLLTWELATLAPGDSGEIVFTATVDTAVTTNVVFTNLVRIDTTTPQTDTLDDTSQATASKLDLIVSKITPLPVVDIYDAVSYTLIITNAGGVTITTMPVTDTYDPAVLEFVSASPAQSSAAPGYLDWITVSLIGPGESISIVVNFRALTSTFGGVTTNTVSVIGSSDGVTLPMRTADAAVRVVAPNLDVIKLSPGNAQAGAVLTYTILITNSGDGAATNVSVLDNATLAGAGLGTVQLVSPSLTIAAGATATLSYPLNVPVPVTNGVQLVNSISVTATESITPLISTVTDTVASTHTLALSKSAARATARPGELITYTINYTLAGNEPVTQAVVGDMLPPFVTYVSSSPAGNYNALAHALDWTINNPLVYASGVTQHAGAIEVVVRADLPLTNGLQLVNTAVVTDSGGLTATDTATVTIASSSVLQLNKSVAQTVTQPGGLLTYTLAYTITGDRPLHGVAITDVLAPHLSYVSAVPPGNDSAGVVTWLIGEVPTNTAGTITLIARVNNVLAPTLDHIDNEATLGESTGTIVTDSVPVALATDLTLRKEADPLVVPAGGLVTYTFIASNLGPVDARGVVVNDPLPASMTGVSASANCTLTPALTCAIGDLLVGAEARVTVTVRLNSGFSGTVVNTARVSATTPEIDLTNNDASAQVATSLPGMALSKSVSRGDGQPVRVRDVVEYTLILTNTGNLDALDLSLSDLVPTGTLYVNDSATPAAELVNRTLVWRIARLAPGESLSVRFQVMIDSVSVGLVLRNTAHVSTGDVDVASSNTVINPYQPTAITLDRFEAIRTAGTTVDIRFDTSVEQNTSGFYIVRATTSDRQSATRVSEFIPSRGLGGGASYIWTDASAPASGEAYYWLEEIETGGAAMFYGPVLAAAPRGPQSWRVFMPIVQK